MPNDFLGSCISPQFELLTSTSQRYGPIHDAVLRVSSFVMSDEGRWKLLYDELHRQLVGHERFSGVHAGRFSNIYYLFRPTALVLATATTVVSSLSSPKNSVITILVGLVTLVTALDSWLKPQVKWKLHDETNDVFNSMLLKLASTGRENVAALEALRKELDALVERYRNARLLE